jgi:subtilisin family serine protease
MPVKVLDSTGFGSSADVAAGIEYAVNKGAKVINLSLGGPVIGQILKDAVKDAYNQNALVVAASGNAGSSTIYLPAAMDEALAVGSTTSTDQRSSFSNYGPELDIVAPGSSIYSTIINSYTVLNGTSMATPHVSGLAALIWSIDSTMSNDEVRQIIQTTADDLGETIGWDQFYGHGRINARRALEQFAINLQDISGLQLTGPIVFLDDDQDQPTPASQTIRIATVSPDVIDWTATISPSVSWLTMSPPASGSISASSFSYLTFIPDQPATYGTHSTTIVITGTTSTQAQVGPTMAEIQIIYVPELHRHRFPLIIKN